MKIISKKKKIQTTRHNSFKNDFISIVQGIDAHLSMHTYGSPRTTKDTVNGARLWEKASNQRSYYLKWNEIQAIQTHASKIAKIVGPDAHIIDLGPGAAISVKKKIIPFLKAFSRKVSAYTSIMGYTAVDLTHEYIQDALVEVKKIFPKISLNGLELDFFRDKIHLGGIKNPVLFCAGNTVGNIAESKDFPYVNLVKILHSFHKMIEKKGYLVVIQDTNQDKEGLKKAYDNKKFKEFTFNVLEAVKRDVSPDFNPKPFSFYTKWCRKSEYFVRQAVATEAQKFHIDGNPLVIKKGQALDIVRSYKTKAKRFKSIGEAAGWKHVETFFDKEKYVAIHLFKA